MAELYDFWITIQDLPEEDAKQLWLKHKKGAVHCTVFPEKTFIYGVASNETIQALIDDINELNKDYGVVRKEVI